MQTLVKSEELYTNFYTFEGVVKALNGVSVVVNQGETYGLVGESGCGKSVTVRSMMRIVQEPGKIVDGKILLFFKQEDRSKGINIIERSEAFMQSIRGNDISMIFQEASTSLNPVFTIGEQVGESFLFHRLSQMLKETVGELDEEIQRNRFFLVQGWKLLQRALFRAEFKNLEAYQDKVQSLDNRLSELEEKTDNRSITEKILLQRRRERLRKKKTWIEILKRIPFLRRYYRRLKKTIRKHVVELLKQLGVPSAENMPDRYPHELSGGMQQRIVIAIALACHPYLLIADEPTSNLDVTIQAQIMELIKTLKKTTIASVLFITHDFGLVAEICDRATVMYAGDVCETADVKTIFRHPLHPYTKGLLQSVPKAEQVERLSTIPGIVPNLIDPPSGCRFHPRCPYAMDNCPEEKPPTIEHSPGHYVACYLYVDKER